VAGAAVLDTVGEQQRSGGTRQKSRAKWEWGASGETWFLLDVKAGIRVAVDKAEHVASETMDVEFGRRWRGTVAARGERGDEATTRAFKRWVRLIGRPKL
jgi:hypothetical protein